MKPEQFTLRAKENHGKLQSFLIRVLFTRSLKPPPPSPAPPPPPVLLPPLAHCLGRSTIDYSVASRASADTPKAKAREQGGSAGQRPSERDTGSILVWDAVPARAASARSRGNLHGDTPGQVWAGHVPCVDTHRGVVQLL